MPLFRPAGAPSRVRGVALFGLLTLAASCLAVGCGSGGKTYRLSGKVNFDGKPVPAGKIYFLPDAAKKNSGPGGYADIKNGSYDTGVKGSMGGPGGATVVKIEGFDGNGKMIFLYQTTADLPREPSTKDFDVPADAAKNVPAEGGPQP